MAGRAAGPGYWPVLIIGNAAIIALEGLVVSIQTTRLVLFEFFIRFLTARGRHTTVLTPPSLRFPEARHETARTLDPCPRHPDDGGHAWLRSHSLPRGLRSQRRRLPSCHPIPRRTPLGPPLHSLRDSRPLARATPWRRSAPPPSARSPKPDLFGRVLVMVGLAEGIAIYGLIVSILILNRLG